MIGSFGLGQGPDASRPMCSTVVQAVCMCTGHPQHEIAESFARQRSAPGEGRGRYRSRLPESNR